MEKDFRKSKYLRSKPDKTEDKKEKEKEKEQADKKKKEYRKNVLTPKRARELALEAEQESEEPAESLPENREDTQEQAESAVKKAVYRASVLTPRRARELALEAEREAETPDDEALIETVDAPEEAEAEERIPEHRKGTSEDMFRGETDDTEKEILYDIRSAEVSTKSIRSRASVRMALCTVALGVLAFLMILQQYTPLGHIPFTPSELKIDISVLPELIATIAYGPLSGIAICLAKNVFHFALMPTGLLSCANNFVTESVFLLFTALLYTRLMVSKTTKAIEKKKVLKTRYSTVRFLFSAAAGGLLSLIPQFFITRFIAYPLMERFYSDRGFTMEGITVSYQAAMQSLKEYPKTAAIGKLLPDIGGLSSAIIVYNLSITLAKLAFVTLLAALLLRWLLPFLVYRNKKAQNNYKLDTELETVKSREAQQ